MCSLNSDICVVCTVTYKELYIINQNTTSLTDNKVSYNNKRTMKLCNNQLLKYKDIDKNYILLLNELTPVIVKTKHSSFL